MGHAELPKIELFANRYELQAEIGSGGMGVIYRAKDLLTGKLVALKQLPRASEFVLTTDVSDSDSTKARIALAREFEILAAIHHPHIIQVQDYGFWDGEPYFTMSLLENSEDIKSYAKSLDLDRKIDLILQVLESLAYLHQRRILHHDIKPTNILVKDGHVYLLDFGLSIEHGHQYTRPTGTITYLAPEIILHKDSSVASDLYAMGVVIYELLTGQRPYQTRRITDLIDEIVNGTPNFNLISELEYGRFASAEKSGDTDQFMQDEPTQSIDYIAQKRELTEKDTLVFEEGQLLSPLAKVVKRLLAKRPEDRYADAKVVIDALNEALQRPPSIETEAIRESYLQSADFVGREEERDQLTDALLAALSGEGSVWLVGGESGVGKSRLISEIERLAKVWGAIVLRSHGEQFNRFPYQYWREPLRRLILMSDISELDASIFKTIVPDIDNLLHYAVETPELLEGNNAEQRINFAITNLFGQIKDPVVVILEDLHWASESLKVLQILAKQVKHQPILILGTYQPNIRPDLPEILSTAEVLLLECFDESGINELTTAILGQHPDNQKIIDFLVQETEGNAFFIVETLRALAEESGELRKITHLTLPASVTTSGIRAAIMSRLMRYPADFRSLLILSAITGRQVDTDLLWHIVQTESAYTEEYPTYQDFQKWLSQSANASILRFIDGRWEFTHDKFREVILEAVNEEQWRNLHQIIAQGYEAVYPENSDYAVALHYHWQQAQNVSKEIDYAILVAHQLYRISEHHEAIEYAENALSKLADDNHQQYSELTEILGRCFVALGDFQQGTDYLQKSVDAAQKAGNQHLEARASTTLGWMYQELGQRENAQIALEKALKIATEINDGLLKADALVQYGTYLGHIDKNEEALACANQAIEIYQQQVNHTGLSKAYNLRALYAYHKQDFEEAIEYLTKSQTSAEYAGDRWMFAATANNLAILYREQGDFAQAEEHIHKSLTIYRRLASAWNIMMANRVMVYIAISAENPIGMKPFLIEALEISLDLEMDTRIASNLSLVARYFMLLQQYTRACQIIGVCLNYADLSNQARGECEQMLDELGDFLEEDVINQNLRQESETNIRIYAQQLRDYLR